MNVSYQKGLHELGDGLFAYLQPNGSWGWSNAGLITADGTSLLVDTLFDLRLTQDMLDAMRPHTGRNPIGAAVNTHGDPDHCFGNQLLPADVELYATTAATEALRSSPPALVAGFMASNDFGPEFTAFMRRRFGAFDWDGIELRLPSHTFEGTLELTVGDRRVQLVELGPAHTEGDAIAYVPDADVAFTGDLLFGGTPLMWEGPVEHWLDACDRILELDARVLVPGHGPVTDASGVLDVQRYLSYVSRAARVRFDAGMDIDQAADDIDLADFHDWGDPERIVVNVATLYRQFDPSLPRESVPELFVRMARWASRH